MKSKYPNKDVDAIAVKCSNYYKGRKDVPFDIKLKESIEAIGSKKFKIFDNPIF